MDPRINARRFVALDLVCECFKGAPFPIVVSFHFAILRGVRARFDTSAKGMGSRARPRTQQCTPEIAEHTREPRKRHFCEQARHGKESTPEGPEGSETPEDLLGNIELE